MMVLLLVAALFAFVSRLCRCWDGDRYREEMIFEDELLRRQQQEHKTPSPSGRNP